jgi:hypothetical protein
VSFELQMNAKSMPLINIPFYNNLHHVGLIVLVDMLVVKNWQKRELMMMPLMGCLS